ncbi:MAG: DNA topology modulation protein [Bacteroidota bacterium]
MKRIMVIGCCGAGKSTFAKQLQAKTGLPLIHLDKEYWKPNWVETPSEMWKVKKQQLVQQEEWIIDGNYGGTMEMRMERADTVIFLDRSRWLCLYRVIKRTLRDYGRAREDMAEGCVERFDWKFLMYVFHFPELKRPDILKRLARLPSDKKIVTLSSDTSIARFLKQLQPNNWKG